MMRTLFVLLLMVFLSPAAMAQLDLAPYFDDHMVLQRDTPLPI